VENNDYAKEVVEICRKNRIRVEADYSDKNMKDKIKTFRNYRDPYVLVLERLIQIRLRQRREINSARLNDVLTVQ
jgi:threonyl-tRNA synthetase